MFVVFFLDPAKEIPQEWGGGGGGGGGDRRTRIGPTRTLDMIRSRYSIRFRS